MDKDDNVWVFESLVGLLRGPIWNVPILTFIEQKSLIFEPDTVDCEEYQIIHNEYKNLVDFMLGSYMEDLGITPEQFGDACEKASSNLAKKFHHSLFEQVWAAEDSEIFKRMMIQKNIELQLQALELLQQRYGIFPESMTCGHGSDLPQDEEEIMEHVLKKSLEDHSTLLASMDSDTKKFEAKLAKTQDEKLRLEVENNREKELLDKAPDQSDTKPEEIAKRKEYLRQQRDKLLVLKKQEREKQLAQMEKNNPQKRPKSARAAKSVLETTNNESSIDPRTLAARRALAARLKAEVIGNQ
uniref:Cilia- and flagella-associated protein 36 n=1 Tax=Strigamia maritima TaxID=126957 RepID=T1JJG8_STRMM